VVIIGGIYTGILTPTEAAAAGVAYAFFVEMFIYKSIKLKDLYGVALKTGTTTAIVFVILAASEALSWVLTYGRVPQVAAQAAMALNPSPIGLLFLIHLIFFIAIAKSYGIDPVHLGVLVTINCAIGTITPPYGCDLFTASAIFNEPYAKVVRGVPIFILLGVIILVICTFVPQFSLWIPDMAFK
jgi:TRAP-type C4-dicarboxylate transport system permease large subunit